jgi:hypothetical protein
MNIPILISLYEIPHFCDEVSNLILLKLKKSNIQKKEDECVIIIKLLIK